MIAVIYAIPDAPPCVAQFTRRVALHVGIRTWCQLECDGNKGVFQMPDATAVCPKCKAAIAAFERGGG